MIRQGSTVAKALIAMGLALAGFTQVARCGEPLDDRLGIRTVPIFLLTRSDVQADLKLDPNQITESHRAASALYSKALALRGKVGGGIVAARRAVDEDQSQWLSTHLTPQQLERLGQVDLQWEGAAAMISRPVVAEYLSLTREQQEQVARYIAEGREQRARVTWTSTEHVNLTRKAISVLSDKQKDLWIHVLGPPCRFAIAARPQAPPDQPARGGSPSHPQPAR
jgi:hypothetical protein